MSRLRRIAIHDRIFFVTTNLTPNSAVLASAERDIVLRVIAEYRDRGAFWLFAYCIMPNHFHLLLSPHNKDLPTALRGIKSVSATRIINTRHSRGPLWQPRYFDNIIRRVSDFWAKLEYIHNNPVAAGLASTPRDWQWSSYPAIMDRASMPIPVDKIDLP
jgi:REP element-mobilizing transposase RayT|nr:transposase [Candidatus Acidoferrales bacterium]